jgi:hypothetical protein
MMPVSAFANNTDTIEYDGISYKVVEVEDWEGFKNAVNTASSENVAIDLKEDVEFNYSSIDDVYSIEEKNSILITSSYNKTLNININFYKRSNFPFSIVSKVIFKDISVVTNMMKMEKEESSAKNYNIRVTKGSNCIIDNAKFEYDNYFN